MRNLTANSNIFNTMGKEEQEILVEYNCVVFASKGLNRWSTAVV